jgi:hypothetical protein
VSPGSKRRLAARKTTPVSNLDSPPRVSSTVTVALVGDPVPIGSTGFSPADDLEMPWSERQTVSLEVEPEETLGAILARAAEQFGLTSAWPLDDSLWPGATLADAFAWVGLYRPEHDHGTPVRPLTSVTLADREGRAVWNNYFKEVTHGQMLWAAEAGALEGDPNRLYLFTWAGFGNGLIADLTTLTNLWDLAWYVLEKVGIGYAAYEAVQRVRDRIRRGREVTGEHKADWQERRGDPGTLSAFLEHRPSTTAEVAGLLGCAEEEADAVLWAFGFAPDEDGVWRMGGDEDAKFLRAVWELIVFGYREVELERRIAALAEEYARTGRAPEIDWNREVE